MISNKIGTRIGWILDTSDERPNEPKPALLTDRERIIEVRMPLRSVLPVKESIFWWLHGNLTLEENEVRADAQDNIPKEMLFCGAQGGISLIGCNFKGFNHGLHEYGSELILQADYAVIGVSHRNYSKINSLRTEIPGFTKWFNASENTAKIQKRSQIDDPITITMPKQEQYPLNQHMNLSTNIFWTGTSKEEKQESERHVYLETSSESECDWTNHLDAQYAILHLVSLSAWQPFGFSEVFVSRNDDDLEYHSPKSQKKWNSVTTRRVYANPDDLPEHPRYLFYFTDIGFEGINKWMKLHKDLIKTIRPMMSVLQSRYSLDTMHILPVGAMLEELGTYIIKRTDPQKISKMRHIPFQAFLDAIISDFPFEPFPNMNRKEFIKRTRDIYTQTKHADYNYPDILDTLNTIRHNILLARAWFALQLGVDKERLEQKIKEDSQYTPLVYA
ncbi:HEPN domain-containing protein [Mobiluncus mulieris]|uniref:ApeA N-terminal domain 1-containing protein n=1 Tax=Mobiluncus mulieris TaxID=2052 RepID=UPI00242FA291|nr:HEPN domain-containing protein [Mobiluncus mulieris]